MTYAMMKVPPESMVSDTFLGIQSNKSTLISVFVTIFLTGVCFWPYIILDLEHGVSPELQCETYVM